MKNNKIGRPKRNSKLAIDCYLQRINGQEAAQIGINNKWRIQRSENGKFRSVTAERYIKEGRRIYKELVEETFGIKCKAPVRTKHRRKPIDK